MTEQPTCELCGHPMPKGEEMFKFHGYSGQCPAPPITKAPPATPLTDAGTPLELDNGTPLCPKHGHRYELYCTLCADEVMRTPAPAREALRAELEQALNRQFTDGFKPAAIMRVIWPIIEADSQGRPLTP